MPSKLWVNDDGTVGVVDVDDDGKRVPTVDELLKAQAEIESADAAASTSRPQTHPSLPVVAKNPKRRGRRKS